MSASANTVPKDSADWFKWVADRLRQLERHRHAGPDVLVATSGEVLQSVSVGWSIGTIRLQRARDVISFTVAVTRTGSTIVAATTSDIANVQIGTLLPGWRPAVGMPMSTTSTGPMTSGYVDTTGVFAVSAIVSDWTTGQARSLGGTWVAQDR